MISTVYSGGLYGMTAYLVQVEVDISTGLPSFGMVGSLGSEVKEARERVQVALRNAGYDLPPMKITVNLAPANVRKEGTAYDLPIAVGMLAAMGYFKKEATDRILFAGELGLDGEIKPVRGIIPIVLEAAKNNIKCCVVSDQNAKEGASADKIDVRGATHISQVIRFLQNDGSDKEKILPCMKPGESDMEETWTGADFSDVCGQEGAVRAAEIAAAGFHNLLMIGPPGAGKSMIAKCIPGILPPLTKEERLEVSSIYSVAGLLKESQPIVTMRPFQSPHHTVTKTAFAGGCGIPKPGIMSLAHRGVLFLDELPEFSRPTLDCMRQPLEEHVVQIARAHGNVIYPAEFMLVCAMNPCICGHYPDRNRCRCTETSVKKYLGRVSGPILDRIDLCIEIRGIKMASLLKKGGESSEQIRKRVMRARNIQKRRFQGTGIAFNAQIPSADIERYCPLLREQQQIMESAYEAMGLSVRGFYRILRVARTIADLSGEKEILTEHLLEAIFYRTNDMNFWQGDVGHDRN